MSYLTKVISGVPHLKREIRNIVSSKTPLFISTPSRVNINLEGPCNGLCIMCPTGIRNASRDTPKRTYDPPDTSLLTTFMEEVSKLSGKGVLYSFWVGEPLLNRALLFALMSKAQEVGACFSFTTNGYLLTQEIVEELVRLSPFNVGVSLESPNPSINETLRPYPNGTHRTLEGIERLRSEIRRQGKATSLNIKVTLTEINHSSVLDIVKRYGRIKGVMVTPQPFETFDLPGETIEKLKIKDVSAYKTTIHELIELKKKGYSINASRESLCQMIAKVERMPCTTEMKIKRKNGCNIGDTTMFIHSALDITLCPMLRPIGNLKGTLDIQDIWFGEDARDVRQQISKCDKICTLSCLRKMSLMDKIVLYLRR